MIRGIIIAVLTVGLIGTGVWGYQEHREKNAILQNAENNYQRAFHDLTFQMDLLNDKIGTALAMNTRTSLSPALAEVWKITSQAHTDVGQLPLTLLPFNKTEEFLANIGNFTYKTAMRDLEKEPLSDGEYESLQKLYKESANIQSDLREVQHTVLDNHLTWMDVEIALAAGEEAADNTIIDGFKTVEKTVDGYSETEFGPAMAGIRQSDNRYQYLKGENISEKDAASIAKKWIKADGSQEIKVTQNGEDSGFGFYSVSVDNKQAKTEATMDITKKGGYPIWFIVSRDVKGSAISLNDAALKAIDFLKKNDFENLDLFESAQYDHTGVFTFVGKEGETRIYPDAIRIKVALDNGDIIGFSAEDYLKSNHVRELPKANISVAEAKTKVNPKVKIMEERQALILNDMKNETLCFEFTGVLGEETYRIYINADTGQEEKVEKLHDAEQIYEDAV